MSKVHCGSTVRFGRALPGFPITTHHLYAFLLYLEGYLCRHNKLKTEKQECRSIRSAPPHTRFPPAKGPGDDRLRERGRRGAPTAKYRKDISGTTNLNSDRIEDVHLKADYTIKDLKTFLTVLGAFFTHNESRQIVQKFPAAAPSFTTYCFQCLN